MGMQIVRAREHRQYIRPFSSIILPAARRRAPVRPARLALGRCRVKRVTRQMRENSDTETKGKSKNRWEFDERTGTE
jgi:hypothetical protein